MTALGKVVRTTAFKLSAIYIAVFSIFAVSFVLYISYSANVLLNDQIRATIAAEIRGLAEQGRTGGIAAIFQTIEERSHQPGASLYLITDVNGRILTGNISQVPADIFERSGIGPITVTYERNIGEGSRHVAMVQVLRLPGGFWMLVGRDIGEHEQFREIIGRALAWAAALMIGLAVLSWFFVSRRVLKRIDSVSDTSRRIVAGDLSGRLEVTGTGDEFDRLAESLNAMLARIEHLLYGLKDVSDNIAHDLKTPLTRLRSRVEGVLAGPADIDTYRDALESTIEESDHLIKTFNALLMIARTEAGSADGAMSEVEAGAIVRDVAELYEPVAEEEGGDLTVSVSEPVTLKASRELLGQALANLIDNALKYAKGDAGRPLKIVVSSAREGSDLVLRVADNGVGVPEADRERVLQRFVRLEASRSQSGSGLGLSLVAAVARLHHGTIELGDNHPGLVVTIRLPIETA
ncbi:ATP-binding protein [Bauldia litoralis]|uniref:histidine kinase n=1 Tax=Bauldia litoralis TaxID=665467 RepID=A0A1G6CFZ5_9HYPH|nr:ATP-binding protein [Bauldia litoralis]SDB31745.1 Signal transduction histidine kinase [Bauldia litoralis]